jgi:hypothetical protein
MTTFARRVSGDTLAGACVALAFVGFVTIVVPWLDPSARDPTDVGAGILVTLSVPLWYAAWALLLRVRRAPAWWAAPLVVSAPALLFGGAVDSSTQHRPEWLGWLLFVAIVAATSGVWSWTWEQIRPRA